MPALRAPLLRPTTLVLLPVIAVLLLGFRGSAIGDAGVMVNGPERILSFQSDVVVHPDASMEVTETIRVLAQGFEIKHGIIREFPTRYKDAEGNPVEVGFRLKEVRRDGVPEQYALGAMANGVSIRIGKPDVYVEPGEHTYTIIYATSRQLGFFSGYDELYWNVTGNGWNTPIDEADAVVSLPEGISGADIRTTAYTGAYGMRGADYSASVADSHAEFHTSRALGRYEGLTIVVQWPEGHVHRPTRAELGWQRLLKRLAVILACLGVIAAGLYYWLSWLKVGVDPPSGFITPRDTPPTELSPAALRYIVHLGADAKAFTTALISLGAKGAVRIEEGKNNKYTLTKLAEPTAPLATDEAMLLGVLFSGGESVEASRENWQVLAKAKEALRASLSRQCEGVYFQRNTRQLVTGVAICALSLAASIMAASAAHTPSAAPWIVLAGVVMLALSILFGRLLPCYTMLGRGVLDGVEGFKLALVGGVDVYGDEHPASQVLSEQFLPYAVALEVHNQWSRRFEQAMAQRAQAEAGTPTGAGVSTLPAHWTYIPSWYYAAGGPGARSYGSFSSFAAHFTSSFNSTISAASTPPGSSSGGGGGGGSSGGGGGGGGGGGW